MQDANKLIMKCSFIISLILIISTLNSYSSALSTIDLDKFHNKSNHRSTLVSDKSVEEISSLKLDLIKLKGIFDKSLLDFINNYNTKCELKLISLFKQRLVNFGFKNDKESLDLYFKTLRGQNGIDDTLLSILLNINMDVFQLKAPKNYKAPLKKLSRKKNIEIIDDNDVKGLYRRFKTWPDEDQKCVYQEYNVIKTNIYHPHKEVLTKRQRSKIFRLLNTYALQVGYISNETFNKLEYLRRNSFVNTRNINLEDYLNTIINSTSP